MINKTTTNKNTNKRENDDKENNIIVYSKKLKIEAGTSFWPAAKITRVAFKPYLSTSFWTLKGFTTLTTIQRN